MKHIYIFLAHHQKFIKRLFILSYLAMTAFFIIGVLKYENIPDLRTMFRAIGSKMGQISTILLVISLIPGILKRINIFGKVESILLLFRRQIGVTAFYTAVLHLGYMSWIKKIATGQNPFTTAFKYQETGFLAITIFVVLWLTSNDKSMHLFGGLWRWIQRMAYIASVALALHLYDAESRLWMVLAAILATEAFSWIVFIIRERIAAPAITPSKKKRRKKRKKL